ncbi:MAG: HD domain-containing protein [Bacteroidales bacterium]|nr:HD domain-containing protein [Bacteroidales bacterium]MDY0197168.1 HD domain-containing protein [Tenuifilaceae bacterium]
MLEAKKKKIVNDPVHGFINISFPLSFAIIEHPFFQRLRHIRQLGLTYLVYPGANHTRFQHALGAMHLMESAIDVLRAKGLNITEQETEAAIAAILLHDIGHGPFSHSLEYSLALGISHERIGQCFMREMNKQFEGRLDMAIDIFEGTYPKRFLHQLVSSQLDVDRMDYLRRDSFFTGVTEGAIGSDRIIKMLNVVDDNLVVEAKGIYSIEKFLIARRLMYWQVYLHKTVVAAEQLLIQLLNRARELAEGSDDLWCSPSLLYFLKHKVVVSDFLQPLSSDSALYHFTNIDDADILVAAKQWQYHHDKALSTLAQMMVLRKLYKVELRNNPFNEQEVSEKMEQFHRTYPELGNYSRYFVITNSVSNNAYRSTEESIKILYNDGRLIDIDNASDMLNTNVLSKDITKYFLCYAK